MSGKKARARTKKSERRVANAANTAFAGEAIPGLLNDIVVTHILGSDVLADPVDLARVRAVSRAMHGAVAATGRTIEQLDPDEAARRGCLSTLMHLHRKGRLSPIEKERLCTTAAKSGNLEILRWAREIGCPWDEQTCN